MAGISVDVELRGFEEADRVLAELQRRGTDLRPVMDEIGAHLVSSTLLRFEREVSPAGVPWDRTIRGQGILKDTGRLRQSITHRAGDDHVEVGTNVIYGAIHQRGGTIRAKNAPYLHFKLPTGQWVRTEQVTIPARPFLGVSDGDADEIVDILRDHLAEVLPQ